MKNRLVQMFGVALCLFAFSSLLHAQESLAQVKNQLKQIDKKWEQYQKSGDVQSMVNYYADDAVILPQGAKLMRGKDAIKAYFEKGKNNVAKYTDVNYNTVEVIGENNLFVETGTYKLNFMRKTTNQPIEDVGKYVTVWKVMPDHSLKIVIDTFNSDKSMQQTQNAMVPGQNQNESTGGREKK